MKLTDRQFHELDQAARRHHDAHVRSRALAVRAVALGHTRQEVGRMLPFTPYSIGQWCCAYERDGLAAFQIAPGRGRQSHVDEAQVRDCLRRSPERFGLTQTRWTLQALGQACPTLAGMSERGILDVLHRLGLRYKRGQPWIHSPDPQYAEKKTPSKRPTGRRSKTRRRES